MFGAFAPVELFAAPGDWAGAAGGLVFEDEPQAARPAETAKLKPAVNTSLRTCKRRSAMSCPFPSTRVGNAWLYIRMAGAVEMAWKAGRAAGAVRWVGGCAPAARVPRKLDVPPASGKAAPQPTPETAPYWEAANNRELKIQYCNSCSRHFFYPRIACPRCGSADVTWVKASGRARLHTYLINHRPASGFEEDAPYAIAVVELEEGPRMMTNIVGVPNTPEELQLDMALEVRFEPRGKDGEQLVPVFTPSTQA